MSAAERIDLDAYSMRRIDRHFVSGRVQAMLRYQRHRVMWMAKARAESDPKWRSETVRWAREANHSLLRELRSLHAIVAAIRGD